MIFGFYALVSVWLRWFLSVADCVSVCDAVVSAIWTDPCATMHLRQRCMSKQLWQKEGKRLASNRTTIEVFFFHSRSKSLVPEGNGIDIDDCGLPPSPLPPAVWLVVKIVNVCKQMQTGTGKCFDLVHMSVCVWACDMVISFDFIYSCGLQVRHKHSPRSLRATGLGEVSLAAAAPRLRVHVRNDHWHCRAEGVSHSHTHTHTYTNTRTPDGKAALTGVD